MRIRITLDAEPIVVTAPITVAELLAQLDLDPHILSVVCNGEVVRRGEYGGREFRDGDVLVAVVQIGGG